MLGNRNGMERKRKKHKSFFWNIPLLAATNDAIRKMSMRSNTAYCVTKLYGREPSWERGECKEGGQGGEGGECQNFDLLQMVKLMFDF